MSFGKKQIRVIAVASFVIIGLVIGLPFIIQEISSTDRANIILTALTVALTAILAGGAIAVAIFTWHNLNILRGQFRQNTFLSLLRELSEPYARENRRLIFQLDKIKSKDHGKCNQIKEAIKNYETVPLKYDETAGKEPSAREYKYAIEETIGILDRVGFFLLKGDPSLKNDAPIWIWTITSQMWERVSWYVMHRKQSHKNYGKYFEDLAEEARNRGFSQQILNGEELENKEVT